MKGYKVHLVTGMLPITTSKFETISIYDIGNWMEGNRPPEAQQLANIIKLLSKKVDIFHCHNEPDWIIGVTGDNKGRARMVFDVHDLNSIRTKKEEPEERKAIELSDGLISVGKDYLAGIVKKYNYKKPNAYVYSCVPSALFNRIELPRLEGIVYEGGVNPVISKHNFLPYRNFSGFLKFCNENNVNFHLYPADPQWNYSYYRNNGAYLYPSKPFHELPNELSRFTAGFVGTPFPDPEFKGSVPNKMFEYLSAGLPCLVFNSPAAAKIVEKHGLGFVVKDLKDVPKLLKKCDQIRPQVRKNRWKFTMENQIKKTERLYREIL